MASLRGPASVITAPALVVKRHCEDEGRSSLASRFLKSRIAFPDIHRDLNKENDKAGSPFYVRNDTYQACDDTKKCLACFYFIITSTPQRIPTLTLTLTLIFLLPVVPLFFHSAYEACP
jgi:hypothetical protein